MLIVEKDEKIVRWYVMRAFRKEALAEARLSEDGRFPFFIPKQQIIQMYHGQKKVREVPVIPSLLFVRGSQEELVDFKTRWNFLQFAMLKTSNGWDYMTVPDKEMDNFIKVTTSKSEKLRYYKPGEIDLKKGQKVRIVGGNFDGVEGTFLRLAGRRSRQLVVDIPDVMAASVEVAAEFVQVI